MNTTKPKPYLSITGDIHGQVEQYVHKIITSKTEYSIQVGDLGFKYDKLEILNPLKHKFFGGNHDNYSSYYSTPHALGDFGPYRLGEIDFFYIRGAKSIDKKFRTECHDWWREEEIPYHKTELAYEQYKQYKPNFVLSHTCPSSIAKRIGNPDILRRFGYNPDIYSELTQDLLQLCFEYHQPKMWIFGHFHITKTLVVNGTKFRCLNINETIKLGVDDVIT